MAVSIAIIDSGVDASHPAIGCVDGGVSISLEGERVLYGAEFGDSVGHGTACAAIIKKHCPECSLLCIRVFSDSHLRTTPESVARGIEWATGRGVRIIHLSLGAVSEESTGSLRAACDAARERGIVLVTAINNTGRGSSPSDFSGVVRVGSAACKDSELFYDSTSGVFVARGDHQRLAWVSPRYVWGAGTSFAAAHVTGLLAKILAQKEAMTSEEAVRALVGAASTRKPQLASPAQIDPAIKGINQGGSDRDRLSWIRKAVLFPYNKEMHSLVRFRDLLGFQVVGVVDIIGKGLVGKDTGLLQGAAQSNIRIGHDLSASLTAADTLILGHIRNYGDLLKRDLLGEVLDQCTVSATSVYSFAEICSRRYGERLEAARGLGLRVQWPEALWTDDYESLLSRWKRSYRRIGIPVVGVFGTSSQQGKFTAQLALRQELLKEGYRLAQIGTEPQSGLFGFDFTFPYGYESTVRLPLELYVPFIETRMWEICDAANPEIVVVGSQSGTIPATMGEPSTIYSLPSLAFLFATKPDAYVLVVNALDDTGYIRQTISALEALGKGKTVLLVISDKRKEMVAGFGAPRIVHTQLQPGELNRVVVELERKTGLPVADVISEAGRAKMVKAIVGFFS